MKKKDSAPKDKNLMDFIITFSDGVTIEIEKSSMSEAFKTANDIAQEKKMAFTFESNGSKSIKKSSFG